VLDDFEQQFACPATNCTGTFVHRVSLRAALDDTVSSSWWARKIGNGTGGRASNRDRRIFDRNGIRMIWRTEELTNSGFNAPEQFPHFSLFMGERTGSVPRHSTVDSTGSTLPVCPWPCGRGPMSYG
jgi:hypothetical protein